MTAEDARAYAPYGGKSLHEQSHGKSFLALLKNRFFRRGFYVLDEPEAALLPQRQLSFLVLIHDLLENNNEIQFLIATHSPIILAFPGAQILSFDEGESVKSNTKILPRRRSTAGSLVTVKTFFDSYL